MLLVLIFCLPSLVFARVGFSKQSHCLDEIKTGTLSLGCPNNQLIKLGRVIYGYSWSNDCSFIDKDCTMEVPQEDIICLTTTNCTVRVVEHPLILQDCWNLAATYVQAEFECIAEYSLQNVCQPQDTTLTYGFISTPNYPNGFTPNLNCPCALFATPGHSIVLEVIDFRLPTCAEAGLILWLGQDFQTKCLTQDPLTVVSNVHQNVTLRFYTLTHVKRGGFLIKYSVLPLSNNATVRLQCYVAPTLTRPSMSTNLPLASRSPLPSVYAPNKNHELNIPHDHELAVEQPELPLSPIVATHSNELIKRIPSGSNVVPPILGTLEVQRDVMSLAGVIRQEQPPIPGLNQSFYKPYMFPNSSSFRPSNMTTVIVCVVIAVIFLLIMINALIWFIFSLRPTRSKPTASCQNIYPHPSTLRNHTKPTLPNYPTPLGPRRNQSQSSIPLDDSSMMSNHLVYQDRTLPQTAPSNRLKTLRSLLFRGHRTLGLDVIPTNNRYYHNRDPDSTLSEYQIRSVSRSLAGRSPLEKSRYEEQEDCVELKSESSFLANPNHGLLNKTKLTEEPRPINSWDDI